MASGSKSVYATSDNGHYVYANIKWDDDAKVTVTITSVNAGWCIKIRGTSTIKCSGSMSNKSASFNGVNGQDYVLQVYDPVEGTYVNNGSPTFTVGKSNDDDDDDGGDSGSSGSGSGGDDGGLFVSHLDVIIDEGIESVNIYKSWDEAHGNHGEDLSNGGWIYSVDDCIHVEISDIKVKPGYKLNMYSYPDGIDRGYQVSNLTLVTDGIHTWCLIMPYDASIIFETTPQGLVYIDNGTKLETYQVFIDNGTSWEQYMPYIDNGTSWDACN